MNSSTGQTAIFSKLLILFMVSAPFGVAAQNYEHDDYETSSEYDGLAVAVDRQLPKRPDNRNRRRQAAWVQVSYVVTADGRAVDPIIVDSSGGVEFEDAVRDVTETWKFEPSVTGAELPLNIANTRFTIRGEGKGTTRKFARHSRHIMLALQAGKVEKARAIAEETIEIGGWSLYESTILWLMVGRVAGAEGDKPAQLAMYRRGLSTGDKRSLPSKARRDLLEDIFDLEVELGHYAGAMRTRDKLSEVAGSADAMERTAASYDEIMAKLEHEEVVAANGTIMTPCDCETGTAIWDYWPDRRTFSFANVSGNVERFEARCERERLSADVVDGKKWSLPNDWGFCQVFVFGDDGATFDFLGHLETGDDSAAQSETAVARNDVLDQRDRSQ